MAFVICVSAIHQNLFRKRIRVSLALNNILDKKYEANGYTYSYKENGMITTSNAYFPQAGFNWLLGLSLRW